MDALDTCKVQEDRIRDEKSKAIILRTGIILHTFK